jgi:hypothetical protein
MSFRFNKSAIVGLALLGMGLTACENGAVPSASQLSMSSYEKLEGIQTLQASLPSIQGPSIVLWGTPVDFSVRVPAGSTVQQIQWNLGDGSAAANRPVIRGFRYRAPGTYRVVARVTETSGRVTELLHDINVIDFFEDLTCAPATILTGPSVAEAGKTVEYVVSLPPCMLPAITGIAWSLDGQPLASTTTRVSVTFPVPQGESALNLVTVNLQAPNYSSETFLRLSMQVLVLPPVPTPTLMPSPTPTEVPDPLACSVAGEKREVLGEKSEKLVSCGFEGTRKDQVRSVEIQECNSSSGKQRWTTVSKEERVISEGACESQSCRLPSGEVLKDGESKIMYTTDLPSGTCASVSDTRTCQNGTLIGNSEATKLVCLNGCGDLGPHGSQRVVVTGEEQVPLQCGFGETGYFDIFNQVSDQICRDGSVSIENGRRGDLKTKGSCPSYRWVPTESWTACTANCGGEQKRIYSCVSNTGAVAVAARCGSESPVESRVCDGNPEAVRSEKRETTTEEVGSSVACPKNQVGVVYQKRDATQVEVFGCKDHSIQKIETRIEYSEWRTENYCRDYVAFRCSHDSLDNAQSEGRYKWMKKCAPSQPVIAEFLQRFENVSVSGRTFGGSGRTLYATFMDGATTPHKVWNAPRRESASCDMPPAVYIAGVCVASCATPEQPILAYGTNDKGGADRKAGYMSFLDAYTDNAQYVSSLKTASLDSREIHRTRVDQWVTELVDSVHDMREFVMESGRKLKVTPNHPIVTEHGTMKLAEDFKVGESLVELGGKRDRIREINKFNHFGKVYNVFVKSNSLQHNIVITNGYLNGTALYQNDGAKFLNRHILRQRLIKGAVK